MLVELHVLQNFAPSNLNRDDTGAPKDCDFGGYRRARVSSQCLKRAVRDVFRHGGLPGEGQIGVRTKRIKEELLRHTLFQARPEVERTAVADAALWGAGLAVKDDGKTQYLLFLGRAEVQKLAEACEEHWDTLVEIGRAQKSAQDTKPDKEGKEKTAKERKRSAKQGLPSNLKGSLQQVLQRGGKAVDVALFGRMLADLPDQNVDAATQVAHAISTNKVGMEFDFYTAVDDLKPDDTAGADMMGTIGFNSACFYRYSNLSLTQLWDNLAEDGKLAIEAVEAFLRASVTAVPTGKQNSMAAQNPPSFVMAVVRDSGLWSLANAFLRPARPNADADLAQASIEQLDAYWAQLVDMYGEAQIRGKWVASTEKGERLTKLKGAWLSEPGGSQLDRLVEKVVATLRDHQEEWSKKS